MAQSSTLSFKQQIMKRAAKSGDIEIIMQIISDKFDTTFKDAKGLCPINYAAMHGHFDTLTLLLNYSPEQLNLVDSKSRTPLYHAAMAGREHIVRQLLLEKPLLDIHDVDLHTPLSVACREGHYRVTQRLIHAGANVNASGFLGYSPLHFATNRDSVKIMKQLINAGANIDSVDITGWTPFFMACVYSSFNMMGYLVENGANINNKDAKGHTPLAYAIKMQRPAVVKWLLSLVQHEAFV